MISRPQWTYVQARLQFRHGERLDETGWRALEAVQSADQLIERARASPLRRFTERINARMSSHAVERMLRDAWRDYVAEVAAWLPAQWRAAVLWTSPLPVLPVIDALLKGAAPAWANQDPALAEFFAVDPKRPKTNPSQTALGALVVSSAQESTLTARWYTHWRSLWPKRNDEAQHALINLAGIVRAHVERLGSAVLQDTSVRYRRDLAQTVTRIFRRHGGSPVAVFCHLILVALDLERLRGALVRRLLFAHGREMEAA